MNIIIYSKDYEKKHSNTLLYNEIKSVGEKRRREREREGEREREKYRVTIPKKHKDEQKDKEEDMSQRDRTEGWCTTMDYHLASQSPKQRKAGT